MRRRFTVTSGALDLASLAAGIVLASPLALDAWLPWQSPQIPSGRSIWPLLGLLFGGTLIGFYVTHLTTRKGVPRPSYGRAVAISGITLGVTALAVVLAREENLYYSRRFLGFTLAASLGLMLIHRAVSRRRPWSESLVLITNEKQFSDHLRSARHAAVVDVLDPQSELAPDPAPVGSTLAIDLGQVLSEPMARYLASSSVAGYPVVSLGVVYEEHTGRIPIVHLADGWELESPLQEAEGYVPFKRALDITLTVLASPVALVLSALIWALIRLDSKGPTIFRQPRVGLHGEVFTLYKFRTMMDGADAEGASFAMNGDPRLTRVGRWLRRSRADELPQLWNVLKGDLSLVGPRPEQVEFVAHFSERIPFYSHRHLVRPGVTGWAQVNYGYADDEADTIDKLTFDLYYLKHMSVWLDLHILGKSFWTVLSGFGAQ